MYGTLSWLRRFLIIVILGAFVLGNASADDVIVNYNPGGDQDSSIPLAPSFIGFGIEATPLAEVGYEGAWINTNTYPVGMTSIEPDIQLDQYLSFTVTGDVTYDSVRYDSQSYGQGALQMAIRSSLDGFSTDIDQRDDLLFTGLESIEFDVSSLGRQNSEIEFRIYHWDSPDETGDGFGGWKDFESGRSVFETDTGAIRSADGITVFGTLEGSEVPGDVLALYDPVGYRGSTAVLPSSYDADGLNAGELAAVGFGDFVNVNVLPVGPTSLDPEVDEGQYITLTIDGEATYQAVQFDGISYGSGPDRAAVRSSVDGFASNLDEVSGLYVNSAEESPTGYNRIQFDVSSLGKQTEEVEFRIYLYDSLDEFDLGGGFQDVASSLAGGSGVIVFGHVGESLPGDFNGDNVLDAIDIDMLSAAVNSGEYDAFYDLDASGTLDGEDRRVWVEDLRLTYFGDSNLDDEFNSSDMVAVFQSGEYEDGIEANSGWATGDWNGDTEFDSGDMVKAFQAGGYEVGPREVAVVPEPSSILLLCVALGCLLGRRRQG